MKPLVSPRSILLVLTPMIIGVASCGTKTSAPDATGIDETPATTVTAPATNNVAPSQPDCTGGPAILETEMLGQTLIVRESIDGRWFCTEYGGNASDFGSIPEPTGMSFVQLTSAGQSGAGTSYVFIVQTDFPSALSVRNEDGIDLPVARGQAGDYFVVFDPFTPQTAAEPVFVSRTFDLIAADGSLITQMTFEGFGAGEFASFEQFQSCVNDAGVDMPTPPAPGQTVPPRDPAPREVLEMAWQMCAYLLYSYLEGNGQGGPEFRDNARFVADCLADAGYFSAFNEPVGDLAAYELAIESCEAVSPGQAAIVTCLSDNGLDVMIDGLASAGAFDPSAADQAWQACRDTFVTWFVSSPMLVPDIMPRFDCTAAEGWIIVLAGTEDFADASYQTVESNCRA